MDLPELGTGLAWDHSQLLTSGALSVVAAPTPNADFSGDDVVDATDFLIWQRGYGLDEQLDRASGDANRDGIVNDADFQIWRDQFGATPSSTSAGAVAPEPTTAFLAASLLLAIQVTRRNGCCF
jgi:hypothetical protein